MFIYYRVGQTVECRITNSANCTDFNFSINMNYNFQTWYILVLSICFTFWSISEFESGFFFYHIYKNTFYLRCMQRRSGLPTKSGRQTHWLVFGSHVAPTPQTTPSQRSLHRPPIQTLGAAQGLLAEQISGAHRPPGNGLPRKPSAHLHVTPAVATIHWASRPHITPSHSVKPRKHYHNIISYE